LGLLHKLFGDPTAVAARHTLTGTAHAHMASWLRSAEALLRRLILIEASAYPKPNTRPLLHAPRKRVRKLMLFTPEKPEDWRVSFRMFADRPRPQAPVLASAGAGGPSAPKESVFVFREGRTPPPPRGLSPSKAGATALRHAQGSSRGKRLLRQDRLWVHHQPALAFRSAWPLAERYEALLRVFNDPAAYARRLARRLHATPHRLAEALRAPPEASHRIACLAELGERVRAAWRPHFSSG
jgi:hypothetical protein